MSDLSGSGHQLGDLLGIGSGSPPDLQDTAVQTVLQQAEALSSGWSVLRPSSGGSNG
jgi:hypothetical protein